MAKDTQKIPSGEQDLDSKLRPERGMKPASRPAIIPTVSLPGVDTRAIKVLRPDMVSEESGGEYEINQPPYNPNDYSTS